MILWLCPKILEDRLLPVPLHVIPVVYHAVTDWIMHPITGCLLVCDGFIANEEVEILDTSLRRKTSWFRRNRRSSASTLRRRTSTGCDCCWEDACSKRKCHDDTNAQAQLTTTDLSCPRTFDRLLKGEIMQGCGAIPNFREASPVVTDNRCK